MRGVLLMAKKNRYAKKQNRYFQKRGENQKVQPVPKSLTASQLAEWKLQFIPLLEEANERISKIKILGYESLAVNRIEAQTGKEYFDFDGVNTREDLIARVTAIRTFINDKGSTEEGAFRETIEASAQQYKGKFGNEYNTEEHNFKRFDTSVIDEELAKRAFENFRKLESIRASQIGRQGDMGVYGSENLIIAMYDAEVKGIDSFDVGNDLLDIFEKENESNTFWGQMEEEANDTLAISGIYLDNLRKGLNF